MEIRLDKEIFVKFEIKQLDKIMRLDNETYLDIKYLALCSFIDRIARYISPDIKNSFVRFENILTSYYNRDDFKLIDMRYFNQGQFLIGDHQNNDYLKQNAKKYYDKLIKGNLYDQLRPIFDIKFNLETIGNDSI